MRRRRPSSNMAALLLAILCSLIAFAQSDDSFTPCSLCEDPNAVPRGTFPGGEDCATFAGDTIASTPADSHVCNQIRIRAFQHCNCPSLTESNDCALCGTTTAPYVGVEYPDLPIDATGFTCGQAEFTAHPVSGSCHDDSLPHQWFCGCPGVTRPVPSCRVCQSETDSIMLHPNRLLPPPFLITCRQYDRELGLSEACEDVYTQAGVDVAGYCGCGSAPQSACTLCGSTTPLPDPERIAIVNTTTTCADVAQAAPYITNCAALEETYGSVCCSEPTTPTDDMPVGEAAATTTTTTSGAIVRPRRGILRLALWLLSFTSTFTWLLA